MARKYLLISMDDERAKHISEVLGNQSCKKIIDVLAEKNEASEKDISDMLGMPINTVEYNLHKLMKAELIEKAKKFFWSKKGKKIDMYKLSNKSIVISPKSSKIKSKLKSILPTAIIAGIGAVLLRYLIFPAQKLTELLDNGGELLSYGAKDAVATAPQALANSSSLVSQISPLWWFVGGALVTIVFFTILNWRKL